MSITSGFYDSKNQDRLYSTLQMGSIFDGIITDGVYASIGNKFLVRVDSGMRLIVQTGRAWLAHSWILNDADYPITVSSAESVLDRIDTVVLEINRADEVRSGRIFVAKGSPSSVPTPGVLVNNQQIAQVSLADIYVKAGAQQITQADVTNNVGTSKCPFVTGVLSTVTTDELVSQWESQFEKLISDLNKAIQGAKNGSGYVFKTGDAMTGDLAMGNNSVTGLRDPINTGDAVNLKTLNARLPEVKLLWTNAKPGSVFRPQKVNINTTGYDAVLVVTRVWIERTRAVTSLTFAGTEGSVLGYDGDVLCWRAYQVTPSAVHFDDSYNQQPSVHGDLTEVDNRSMVPWYIYGIKFGGAK